MKFSVIHPTARTKPPYPSFPTGWRESMQAFFDRCDHPEDVEYVLVVHGSNWMDFWKRFVDGSRFPGAGLRVSFPSLSGQVLFRGADKHHWGALKVVRNDGPNTGVAQGNAGCAVATGDILHGSMDDLFPPEHWDTLLWEASPILHLNNLLEYPLPPERVIHCSSGSPKDDTLFIPQIQTKARYDRLGYGGHPTYESMFVDDEFSEHARMDGVVIEARHIVYEHRHPLLKTAEMDEVYGIENREQAYRDGLANFEHRKRLGFPGESVKQTAPKRTVIAVCLPGETFSMHWVMGWTSVLGYLAGELGYTVHPVFGFTSNVHCTRMELTKGLCDPRPDLVLWIDDDNVVKAEDVAQLIQDLEEHPELDGVVGCCWCDHDQDPQKPPVLSCGRQDLEMRMLRFTREDVEAAKGPLVPIDWSGFPCVLLRYRVIERLGPEAFLPIVDPKLRYGFSSEDTSFFWAARQAGFKFAVDLRVKVPHLKLRAIEFQPPSKTKQADQGTFDKRGQYTPRQIGEIDAEFAPELEPAVQFPEGQQAPDAGTEGVKMSG